MKLELGLGLNEVLGEGARIGGEVEDSVDDRGLRVHFNKLSYISCN